MRRKGLDRFVAEHPFLALGVSLLLVLLVGLSGWFVYSQMTSAKPTPQVVTVTFGDGQNTVTVNQDGTVTITTPFGTFTQTWDKEKIRQFFANLDNLDFDMLTKYVGSGVAVELTLGNGKTITVIPENLEGLTGQMQAALEEVYKEEEIKRYTKVKVSPEPEATPEPDNGSVPNQGNTGSSGSGGSNPWQTGGTTTDAKAFTCANLQTKEGKKVIISNTVCEK